MHARSAAVNIDIWGGGGVGRLGKVVTEPWLDLCEGVGGYEVTWQTDTSDSSTWMHSW